MSAQAMNGQATDIEALARRLEALDDLPGRVRAIAKAVPGRIAFSTSLGLEDQAILHAVAESGAPIDVFTLDTGRLFPETIETLEASERRYGLCIRVLVPNDVESSPLLVSPR